MTTDTTAPPTGLRVIELRARDVMGLRAVDITVPPDQTLVTISGRNAQGKSSVLNALWLAIAGGAAARQIPAPVRRGAPSGEVTVDLGELRITRTLVEGGPAAGTLKVVAADGSRLRSPQSVLDALMGALALDPVAFLRKSDRDQAAELMQVVRLPFDPAALDAERQGLYDRRRDVNRDVSRMAGELATKPTPPVGTPVEKVSITDLAEQHAAATRAHAAHLGLVRDAEDAARRVQTLDQRANQIEAEIARLQGELAETLRSADTARSDVDAAQTAIRVSYAMLPDVDQIAAELAQAEQVNGLVQLAQERAALADLVAEQQRTADALTKKIADIDAYRERALAEADMPVPGLGFTDEGVTLHGVPLAACSAGERLRAAVGIAMAANPDLRVIRVTDASLLDDDGMRSLTEMAGARGFQVWAEVVDSSGTVGIVIEDGEVFADNRETAGTR